MDENEAQEGIIDLNLDNEESVEETPVEEPKVEKPKRSPKEELEYFEGRAKRLRKQMGLDVADKPTTKEEAPAQKPTDFDYGQKAFLKSFDIKGADELALVKQWVNRTGDDLDTMVEDDIFQAKLKSLREAKATADAIPKGTKRSNQAQANDVDYWLTQPFDQVPQNLKQEVLNTRIKNEKEGNQFSSNPIVVQ